VIVEPQTISAAGQETSRLYHETRGIQTERQSNGRRLGEDEEHAG
jgi:hypothetical protein